MTTTAQRLLPREHRNSCDQAKWATKAAITNKLGDGFQSSDTGQSTEVISTVGIHKPGLTEALPWFQGTSVICNICVNIMEVLGFSVLFKRWNRSTAFGSEDLQPGGRTVGFGKP